MCKVKYKDNPYGCDNGRTLKTFLVKDSEKYSGCYLFNSTI